MICSLPILTSYIRKTICADVPRCSGAGVYCSPIFIQLLKLKPFQVGQRICSSYRDEPYSCVSIPTSPLSPLWPTNQSIECRFLEPGGEDTNIKPWVWILWLGAGPIVGSMCNQIYIYLQVPCPLLSRCYSFITPMQESECRPRSSYSHSTNPCTFHARSLIHRLGQIFGGEGGLCCPTWIRNHVRPGVYGEHAEHRCSIVTRFLG